MRVCIRQRLALTSMIGLMIFAPRSADAGAVAYSRDLITNINLATGLANNFANNGVSTNSQDFADLNSAGASATDSQNLDPVLAAVGPNAGAAAENTFVPLGPLVSKADAVIANNLRSASGDADVNLNQTDTGSASSSNTLRLTFTLTNADTLTLSFTAAELLQAMLHPNAQAGSQALARSVVDIDIRQNFGNFDTVFQWRPDGAGTITGGATNNDPFSLNNELNEVNPGGNMVYNKAAANFSATTNNLGAGQYVLDFYMSQTAFAEDIKSPEPATIVSAALGILVLVQVFRRSRSAA